MAGIGSATLFQWLHKLGLYAESTAFADHHAFTPADLAFPGYDTVLLTKKDAVKCADSKMIESGFFRQRAPETDLAQFIVHRLQASMDPKLLEILVCPVCRGR